MSIVNGGPGDAILPSRAIRNSASLSPALHRATRADTSKTDLAHSNLLTISAQQIDSQVAGIVDNAAADANDSSQPSRILENERQLPPWNIYCPSTLGPQAGPHSASEKDERTRPEHTRESPTNQMTGCEDTIPASALPPMKGPWLRKQWDMVVCRECLNAKHLTKHEEMNKKPYKGAAGALSCKMPGCARWVSSLWKSEFVRSEDCTHTQNPISASASMPAKKSLRTRKDHRRQSKAGSKHYQNKGSKVAKKPLPQPQTSTRQLPKHSGLQTKANFSEKDLRLAEMVGTQCEQNSVTEQRQPRVQPGFVVTNGHVRQGVESFNLDILDSYKNKHIEHNLVENIWARIQTKISEFDLFVRGVPFNENVRDSLRFLDNIIPFSDLQEIVEEAKSPEEYDDPSRLLWVFKTMFKVPMYTSLHSRVSDHVRQLKFSYVLRATVAYLLHLKIFSTPGKRSERQEMEKSSTAIWGEQQGPAFLQYLRLRIQQSDDFQWFLKHRAEAFARSIHSTLRPLCRWEERDACMNHEIEKQLKLLMNLTHDCLSLATDLHARENEFIFVWPASGDQFNPELHNVDVSQVEAVAAMTEDALGRQVIALTLMPLVQEISLFEVTALTYARAFVLLREPYVE